MKISSGMIRLLNRLIKITDPFEEISLATDMDDAVQRLELFGILEVYGAFSPELFTIINDLGVEARETELAESDRMKMNGKTGRSLRRAHESFNRKWTKILDRKLKRRRFAGAMIQMLKGASYFEDIKEHIRVLGPMAVIELAVKQIRMGDVVYLNLLSWFVIAYRLRGSQVEWVELPDGMTEESIFKTLQETDIYPRKDINFFLTPWVNAKAQVRLLRVDQMDPLNIATFSAGSVLRGNYLEWNLSRVTGELVSPAYAFRSLGDSFALLNVQEHYMALRRSTMVCLYNALMSGQIEERIYIPFLDIDADTDEVDISEILQAQTTEEIPITSALAEQESVEDEDFFNPTRTGKKRSAKLKRSQLNWRRIMRTLLRCGVEVTWGSKHPKLSFQGKNTTFLNPHSQDTRKNQYVLWNALKQLGIPRQTYIDNQ